MPQQEPNCSCVINDPLAQWLYSFLIPEVYFPGIRISLRIRLQIRFKVKMNTCGDEVLPYPPDVLNGLKAFRIGLYVAFGLASLSHIVIHNIRREKNCESSLTEGNAPGTLSNFYALTVHLVPIIFIISQELNYSYWNMYRYYNIIFLMRFLSSLTLSYPIISTMASVRRGCICGRRVSFLWCWP